MTYLLMCHGEPPREGLSLKALYWTMSALYRSKEWPEGEKELIEEINAFNPVALRVAREE